MSIYSSYSTPFSFLSMGQWGVLTPRWIILCKLFACIWKKKIINKMEFPFQNRHPIQKWTFLFLFGASLVSKSKYHSHSGSPLFKLSFPFTNLLSNVKWSRPFLYRTINLQFKIFESKVGFSFFRITIPIWNPKLAVPQFPASNGWLSQPAPAP